jgi:hypothetical protein
MRTTLIAFAALLAGCATANDNPPQTHVVSGEPAELAACAYRHLRNNGSTRMTPLPGGAAELRDAGQVCGLFGCSGEIVHWSADLEPAGPGRTRVVYRHLPSAMGSWAWPAGEGPQALLACSRNTPG